MVLGEDKAHGTSSITSVGPPGGLDTLIVPSNADSRRITPRIPVPAAGIGAAAAVVAHDDPEHAGDAVVRDLDPATPGAGVLAGVGQALGDREVDGRLDRRRRPSVELAVTVTGMAMSSASACTARPARGRPGPADGCRGPPTAGRRGPRPSWLAPHAGSAGRPRGRGPHISSAMPRLIPRATSRACAPSCRSRSIRRSSVAEWSMRLRAGLGQRLDAPLQDLGVPVRRATTGPAPTGPVMIGPTPNHHSAHVTTSRKSSTTSSDSAKPTVAETSSHARSRQVIGSPAQPTIRWTEPSGRSLAVGRRERGAEHPAGHRPVPVGDPPARRDGHEQQREPDDHERTSRRRPPPGRRRTIPGTASSSCAAAYAVIRSRLGAGRFVVMPLILTDPGRRGQGG